MAGCLALSGRLDFFNLSPTQVTPYMSTKGSSLLRELTGEISGSVSFWTNLIMRTSASYSS